MCVQCYCAVKGGIDLSDYDPCFILVRAVRTWVNKIQKVNKLFVHNKMKLRVKLFSDKNPVQQYDYSQ